MGRTTASEKKEEFVKFRIKPSLRKKILELQAQGDFAHASFQDYVVVLICRGIRVQEAINRWAERLTIDAGKELGQGETKGGAVRRSTP